MGKVQGSTVISNDSDLNLNHLQKKKNKITGKAMNLSLNVEATSHSWLCFCDCHFMYECRAYPLHENCF